MRECPFEFWTRVLAFHLCEGLFLFSLFDGFLNFLLLVIRLGLLLVFPFNILDDLFNLIHFLVKHFLISLKRFEAPLRAGVKIELSLLS